VSIPRLSHLSDNADISVLLFKQTEQPVVHKGNIAASVASALQVIGLVTILFLSGRDQKRRAAERRDSNLAETPGTEDVDKKSLH
jgi:hypothetical protein